MHVKDLTLLSMKKAYQSGTAKFSLNHKFVMVYKQYKKISQRKIYINTFSNSFLILTDNHYNLAVFI